MSKFLNTLRTEPVVIAGFVQSLLALLVGLGLSLTAGQTGALEAGTTAVLALVAAVAVRPFPVAALTGALSAVATVLVAFGVHHVSSAEISSLNAVIVSVLSLVLRGHVTPTVPLVPRPAPVPTPAPPVAA